MLACTRRSFPSRLRHDSARSRESESPVSARRLAEGKKFTFHSNIELSAHAELHVNVGGCCCARDAKLRILSLSCAPANFFVRCLLRPLSIFISSALVRVFLRLFSVIAARALVEFREHCVDFCAFFACSFFFRHQREFFLLGLFVSAGPAATCWAWRQIDPRSHSPLDVHFFFVRALDVWDFGSIAELFCYSPDYEGSGIKIGKYLEIIPRRVN